MKSKQEFRRIASERIVILFRQAEIKFHEDASLSDRYVKLARKIAMRYKVKILQGLLEIPCARKQLQGKIE
jgi:ribonuclease P protein subunit RPR2